MKPQKTTSPAKKSMLVFVLCFLLGVTGVSSQGFNPENISAGYHRGALVSYGANTKNTFWPTGNDIESGWGVFLKYSFENQDLSNLTLRLQLAQANNAGKTETTQFYGHLRETSLQALLNLDFLTFDDESLFSDNMHLYLYAGLGRLSFDAIHFENERSRNMATRSAMVLPLGLGFQYTPVLSGWGSDYAGSLYLKLDLGFRLAATENLDGGITTDDSMRRIYNYSSISIGFDPTKLANNHDFAFRTRPEQSVYGNFSIGQSAVYDQRSVNLSQLYDGYDVSNTAGVRIEAGYIKRFRPLLSYGVGLGYSNFSSQVKDLDFSGRDLFNHTGSLSGVDFKGVNEKLDVSLIDVPFFLEFGNTNIDKWGYYAKAGLSLGFLSANRFLASGQFVKDGVATDLYAADYEPDLNSFQLSAILGAGISRALSRYGTSPWMLRAGVYYQAGITNVVKNPGFDDRYTDMERPEDFKVFNTVGPTRMRHIGFELGLHYLIVPY